MGKGSDFQHMCLLTRNGIVAVRALGWNETGDEGAAALGEALKKNSALTTLRYAEG